jgi:hypothetical protein
MLQSTAAASKQRHLPLPEGAWRTLAAVSAGPGEPTPTPGCLGAPGLLGRVSQVERQGQSGVISQASCSHRMVISTHNHCSTVALLTNA